MCGPAWSADEMHWLHIWGRQQCGERSDGGCSGAGWLSFKCDSHSLDVYCRISIYSFLCPHTNWQWGSRHFCSKERPQCCRAVLHLLSASIETYNRAATTDHAESAERSSKLNVEPEDPIKGFSLKQSHRCLKFCVSYSLQTTELRFLRRLPEQLYGCTAVTLASQWKTHSHDDTSNKTLLCCGRRG